MTLTAQVLKVLFTDGYTLQNFGLQFLSLVNIIDSTQFITRPKNLKPKFCHV
jgi:hypothetical protein